MKAYVAMPFRFKEEAARWYQELEAIGYEITYKWATSEGNKTDDELSHEMAQHFAIKDYEGVIDADLFIIFPKDESVCGALIELGIAIAQRWKHREIYIVDPYRYSIFWEFGKVVTEQELRKELCI
jgi:hypothetical protein